jgi:hypothetical protein
MGVLPSLRLENRRGAVIPIVAVCLVMLITCAAIAVDLAMILNTRAESQRGSDAAALAGAAAFVGALQAGRPAPQDSLVTVAEAILWAGRNRMLSTAVAPSEVVSVEVIRDSAKVRVTVQRAAVSTWFARIFGVNSVPVGSMSAARSAPSGTAGGLKPFAVPSHAYDPDAYGELRLVVDSRNDEYVLVGFGGGPPGGGNFQDDIRLPGNDRTARISLADPWLWAKPSGGLPPGQIRNPFNDLYASDPTLVYNEGDGKFYRNGVEELNWRASPRVGNVAIVDESTIVYNPTGAYMVKIVDIVAVFFEGPPQHEIQCAGSHKKNDAYCSEPSQTWVWGRFFQAVGQADNCVVTNTCAPSLYRLRLVE